MHCGVLDGSWNIKRHQGKSWLNSNKVRASLLAQTVKNLLTVQETQVQSLIWQDPLEEGMATHSSFLAWRIPWTEEPGGLYSPWGRKVSDTTERSTLSPFFTSRFQSPTFQLQSGNRKTASAPRFLKAASPDCPLLALGSHSLSHSYTRLNTHILTYTLLHTHTHTFLHTHSHTHTFSPTL